MTLPSHGPILSLISPQILEFTTGTGIDGVELAEFSVVIGEVCLVILSWEGDL